LQRGELVDRWPVEDERMWLKEIEWPLEEQIIDLLRQCVNRQRPFGKIRVARRGGGETVRTRKHVAPANGAG